MKPDAHSIRRFATAAAVVIAACAVAAGYRQAVATPPFGGPEDVKFANDLWSTLAQHRLVGSNAIASHPYKGTPPHGKVLEFLMSEETVDGVKGTVMVKKNYSGEAKAKELIDQVQADPSKYLASVTVLFKRKPGYDPAHKNWFWVKYAPDGTIEPNAKGMKQAGRVAEGMSKGCIACHSKAPGGNYVYDNVRIGK